MQRLRAISFSRPYFKAGLAIDSQSIVIKALPALFKGALVTGLLTVTSAILGLVGGSLLGIARLSSTKPLRGKTPNAAFCGSGLII
jgi:arginine/lysine/histidine/glutamine transport system substrate-binding and permease protein